MNAWLRSPALLHVIAEHALRNSGSTELEIWYRDLCVTGQSPGHLQGQERRRAQLHVTRAGQEGRAVVHTELQEKPESSPEPKVIQAATLPVAFQGRAS